MLCRLKFFACNATLFFLSKEKKKRRNKVERIHADNKTFHFYFCYLHAHFVFIHIMPHYFPPHFSMRTHTHPLTHISIYVYTNIFISLLCLSGCVCLVALVLVLLAAFHFYAQLPQTLRGKSSSFNVPLLYFIAHMHRH